MLGKLSVCERQQKLLMSKAKRKNTATSNRNEKSDAEDKSVDFQANKVPLFSHDEDSSDSSDDGLHIDSEEESSIIIRLYFYLYKHFLYFRRQ